MKITINKKPMDTIKNQKFMNTLNDFKGNSVFLFRNKGQMSFTGNYEKFLILKWMLLILLLMYTVSASAQTSQTPTQTVSVGNEPYLVSPTPGSTYNWAITPGNSGTNWTINGTGNSISVDWNLPGVYTLSVIETNSAGCVGLPVTVVVTVNQTPNVNVPPDQTVCNGTPIATVNFTGSVAGTVYSWTNNTPGIGLASSGTGNIASFNAVNTGTSPIVATITVTPSFTNAGTTYTGTPQTFTITVMPLPVTSPIYHN
jgi:hypothetical protein